MTGADLEISGLPTKSVEICNDFEFLSVRLSVHKPREASKKKKKPAGNNNGALRAVAS